jgi:hypothetical protein
VTNASGDRYFITAGHCTNEYENWYQAWSNEYLGNRVRSSFPGNDYGIVKYYQPVQEVLDTYNLSVY